MIRTCNGNDRNLLDGPTSTAGPCACGLTFDDVRRSTIYPHVFIPTREEKEAIEAFLDSVVSGTGHIAAQVEAVFAEMRPVPGDPRAEIRRAMQLIQERDTYR